jgi:tRNA(Ile)-lysidine synthase
VKVAERQGADQRAAQHTEVARRGVDEAVRDALAEHGPLVLAVSGGRDSMALLHAAARVARREIALVATFDHQSGAHATAARALVERTVGELGLPLAVGAAAPGTPATEAGWRRARWAFLRRAAAGAGGRPVATAHTEDDQVETVFMRALRGSGARGLAALYAPGPIVRPLVGVRRAVIAAYASAHEVRFVADPGNDAGRFLRSRVRHELLPAACRLRPGFDEELLALARRAAAVRAGLEEVAALLGDLAPGGTELIVPAAALTDRTGAELAELWPALAARVGVVLDRRGTARLARFTTTSRNGQQVPLSGGATVRRVGGGFVLRCGAADIPSQQSTAACEVALLDAAVRHGRFSFRRRERGAGGRCDDLWTADFRAGSRLTVRSWAPGDRMHRRAGGEARRVKRFFAEARVPAVERPGWPVVLVDGAIAWIPGVCRSDAATVRPGWPAVRYDCDRNHG